MLKTIRRTLATLSFAGLLLLFLDISGVLHHWLGFLAKLQFWPAVLALNAVVIIVLVALTLIFGRIYCSVICPLGIFQDIIAAANRKRNHFSYSPEKRILRYGMLAVFIGCFFAGIGAVVSILEPYSSFGRIATHLFKPLYQWANNLLALIAERVDSYAFYDAEVWLKSLPTLLIALATVVLLLVLAFRHGRTYCNTICPVGTLLSFLSRFSWFKISFDADKCKNCGKCSRNCKAACIDFKTHSVDYSRCVVCGNCLEQCSFDALHYCHPIKPQPAKKPAAESVDKGKRAFLGSVALTAVATAVAQGKKKVDGGLAAIEKRKEPTRQTIVTPPGSVSLAHFTKHCTACQLCVAQCPNEVLRPTTEFSNFMQPHMSYERGFCRPECHRCSEVCPAGAILPISLEEKSSTQIGRAVWIADNCLPATDGVSCGNCARHCPTGAIYMVPLDPDDENSPEVPAVNEARCIGCGACENSCPARPFAAIYVEGNEVHRQN